MRELLTIRLLDSADAGTLSSMLRAQPAGYLQYFTPFDFDEGTITRLLTQRIADVYLGIFWDGEMAAFCMLRGWDEGYEVPAYGAVVTRRLRGRGLGALTLEACKTLCRLRGSRRLMLKVHPDNSAARELYERAGFRPTGWDPRNRNLIMHCDLEDRSGAACAVDLPTWPGDPRAPSNTVGHEAGARIALEPWTTEDG